MTDKKEEVVEEIQDRNEKSIQDTIKTYDKTQGQSGIY